MSWWNHSFDIPNNIKHCARSFSVEAFRNVQTCFVNWLTSQTGRQRRCWQCQSLRPQARRSAPDHILGLYANRFQSFQNPGLRGEGTWETVGTAFPFMDGRAEAPKGGMLTLNRKVSCWAWWFPFPRASVSTVEPSKYITHFPAGSHILQ